MSTATDLAQRVLVDPAADALRATGVARLERLGDAYWTAANTALTAVEWVGDRLPVSFVSARAIRGRVRDAFWLGMDVGERGGFTPPPDGGRRLKLVES